MCKGTKCASLFSSHHQRVERKSVHSNELFPQKQVNFGVIMKRKWGQHFLVRERYVQRMIELAGVQAGDKVLENAPNTPRECAKILEEQPALEVIQTIGRTIILYRPHPEDPKIIPPSSD